jgi:molybdenum cofactor synthesis domain-containing protein
MPQIEDPNRASHDHRPESPVSAAIVIIGDEILTGRTTDANTSHIAQKLNDHGIQLREVRILPDIELDLVSALRHLSDAHDYVFTTGGIGPTHDDITAQAVAHALDRPLEVHQGALDTLRHHYGEDELTDARKKMAHIPRGANLIDNPVSGAPGFQTDNVYSMAGVPDIMRGMLDHILPTLAGGRPVKSRTLSVHLTESEIAKVLEDVLEESEATDLTIGSYPYFRHGRTGVSLVIRTMSAEHLDQTADNLSTKLLAEYGDDLDIRITEGEGRE